MKLENSQAFLTLVRLGINHELNNDSKLTIYDSETIDWTELKVLAERQGLFAILMDGIEKVRCQKEDSRCNLNFLSQKIVLQWIGEVLQNYEKRFQTYRKAIGELASFYNAHGLKMMVLKGYACNIDWPKPEHRPCGDIDIWLFGKQREADNILGEWFLVHDSGLSIDTSHHHHTVFEWNGFAVENHYDFVNVHHDKSNASIEKIFKELGQDAQYSIEVLGVIVYIPSPNLHALFLLRHMLMHFVAIGINLRQILDWAFFVEKHTKEVDWEWLNCILEKFHMKEFFNIINAICVYDLGFNTELFPTIQFLPELKERVLGDILSPEYDWMDAHRLNLIPRMLFKFRRWKSGAWKRKLCYKESDLETFFWGIRSHLLKPATI